MRLYYAVLLLLLPAFLLISGCKGKIFAPKPVTLAETAGVKVGMSYSDVVKLLGREGLDEAPNGKIYTWTLGSGKATFLFNNDKYVRYSTTGTMPGDFGQKCMGLNRGQDNYEKVVQILGQEGKEITGGKSYVWVNKADGPPIDGTSFRVLCQDGKVIEKDETKTP